MKFRLSIAFYSTIILSESAERNPLQSGIRKHLVLLRTNEIARITSLIEKDYSLSHSSPEARWKRKLPGRSRNWAEHSTGMSRLCKA